MKYSRLIPVAALSSLAFIACEDTTTIGSTIVGDPVEIIVDSAFTVTGNSVEVESLVSHSEYQLLGRINAEGYGFLEADFASGFMPSNAISTNSNITAANCDQYVDSVLLAMVMRKGDLVGDSIIPLGLEVFELNKSLTSGLKSNSSLTGYYDASKPIASSIYNASVIGLPDSIAEEYTYSSSSTEEARVVYAKLPKELGQRIYKKYLTEPAIFNDPIAFNDFFHGLYIRNTYGSGRIMRFENSAIYLYSHYNETLDTGTDTTYSYVNTLMAVTPEVVLNNKINQTLSNSLVNLAKTNPIIVGPIGYDTEINIPVKKIVESYRANSGKTNVVNNLTITIPAEAIANDYGIDPPETILLVKKSERADFFENNTLTDNATSFYATYDSSTGTYSFTNMRQFVIDAIAKDSEGTLTDADGEYVLTPVNLVTETYTSSYYTTSEVVIAITPYVNTPAMVKLDLANTKLYLTFSKQTMQ
jgi:hypothetical protein